MDIMGMIKKKLKGKGKGMCFFKDFSFKFLVSLKP